MSVLISAHPNFVPISHGKNNAPRFGKSIESEQTGENFGKSAKSKSAKKGKKILKKLQCLKKMTKIINLENIVTSRKDGNQYLPCDIIC